MTPGHKHTWEDLLARSNGIMEIISLHKSQFRQLAQLFTMKVIAVKVFKIKFMASVNINSEDSISVKEFEEGNSIQVRVTVSEKEKTDYEKGQMIKVFHKDREMAGRIVSDPILIDRKREDGKVTLSLIVEKATPE